MISMMEYKTRKLMDRKMQLDECHNICSGIIAMKEMKMNNGHNPTTGDIENVIQAIEDMSSTGNRLVDEMLIFG